MVGLEFHPLTDSIQAHWKQVDSGGLSSFLVPNLDDMLATVPSLYVMQTLLAEHRIYTQTTRSNPLVLRVEPPLSVTAEEIDRFVAAVGQCCEEFAYLVKMLDSIIGKSGVGLHQPSQSDSQDNGVPRPVT